MSGAAATGLQARPVPWAPLAALAMVLVAGCMGAAASSEPFLPEHAQKELGPTEAWQPKLLAGLGDPASSGLDDWPARFNAAPKSYDIDGDGHAEVIAQSDDTNVYVFDLSGRVLASLPTTTPPAWHVQTVLNAVEVAVLRPGESASLVVTNHAGYVSAWTFVPEDSDGREFAFERRFNERMTACFKSPAIDAKAAVGDLDGDGILEIVVQTEEIGSYALRADGSILWKQCWAGGNSAPVIADLDGDGRPEVILGSDTGLLAVLAGKSGAPLWTFDARSHGLTPASIVVSPTVADLDGEGPLEVLFTARHAPPGNRTTYDENHVAIFAVHQDPKTYQAELLWMRQPEWANPLSNTQLVVVDADNDGDADIFGMDWNTIGHRPGDWERLGPAHIFRLDADGNDVWVREMETWWSNQDIALADIDGNGKLSILANGPAGPYDGLWRLSAKTGAAEAFLPLSGWKVVRGPQLVDLASDGTMQLMFPVEPIDGADEHGAILVFDLDVAFDAPWPGAA